MPVNNAICKATVTNFSELGVSIWDKVLKDVLPSLSMNTVSVRLANVVKVTTTPT